MCAAAQREASLGAGSMSGVALGGRAGRRGGCLCAGDEVGHSGSGDVAVTGPLGQCRAAAHPHLVAGTVACNALPPRPGPGRSRHVPPIFALYATPTMQ